MDKQHAGVTVIELLIVISIVAILGASTAPFLINFIQRTQLDTTVDSVIGTIRKAQGNAITGKLDTAWGACLYNGDTIRLYNDTCVSSTVKEDFTVPGTITIIGFNDTTFSKGRGEPSIPLSITISSSYDSNTITVNEAGGMKIE